MATPKWIEADQRWRIRVTKDGVRKAFYSSIPGHRGAKEANDAANAWLDSGIDSGGQRVRDLYPNYVNKLKRTTSTTNWKKAEYVGRVYILPAIGHKMIDKVNDGDLQDIIDDAAFRSHSNAKKGQKGGLSKKSLENMRATMVSFIKFCRKHRLTTYVPEDITIPKSAKRSQKTVLQPEHLAILFSSDLTTYRGKLCRDPYINAYRFAVLTGHRPGELIALRPEDINGYYVNVRRSINTFSEETDGKNENAVRTYRMTESAKTVMDAQLADNDPGQETVFGIDSQHELRDNWYRYCACNGLPRVTPYEMRHTFVSIAKNLPEGKVKQLVGHSKNMDTFGVYGHLMHGEMEQTAHELNAVFEDILKAVK